MDIIPLRSLARKALAHLSNNCWISALSFAEVRAFGIHTSKTHATASTENATNFFIVGAPFNSNDYPRTDPDNSDYARRGHRNGVDYLVEGSPESSQLHQVHRLRSGFAERAGIWGTVLTRENQKDSMRQTSRVDQDFWVVRPGRQRARICEPW